MNEQTQKRNTSAMLMFAIAVKRGLELAEQQTEQDAQLIKQAEQYAEQRGMSEWHGKNW